MLVTVLGYKPIRFTNSDGQLIEGTNLFVAFKSEGCEGLKADKVFVRAGIPMPKDLKLNGNAELYFDYKGKLEAIEKAN